MDTTVACTEQYAALWNCG